MSSSARQVNGGLHEALLLKGSSLDDSSNYADFERRIKEVRNVELIKKNC
jgi:hypothetical protein